MSYEPALLAIVDPLLNGRFYADVPPDKPAFPFATYQQIGGQALWLGERAMPSHKHARVQINVWAETRAEANTLARAIEGAICTGMPNAQAYGAATADYAEAIKKYGTRQDFGLWYPDP